MIVNKIIIILCIIFLILLLRKLSYENFNTASSSNKIKYYNRPNDEVEQRYEDIITKIKELDPNDEVMKKILVPLKKYSSNKVLAFNTQELNNKINDFNKKINNASDNLHYLNNNLVSNFDLPEKMFNHLEGIIKNKLDRNNSNNIKAQMIKEKMERINDLISKSYNTNELKSITCIENGKTLNIIELNVDKSNSYENSYENSLDKKYKIILNDNFLFYELRHIGNKLKVPDIETKIIDEKDGTQREIKLGSVCRKIGSNEEANKVCKFIPTDGNYNYIDIDGINNSVNNNYDYNGNKVNKLEWNRLIEDKTYQDSINNIGMYFYIKKILDMKEYNSIITNSGSYETGNIEYPFYIVQPTNHPDMCLNLKEDNTGINIITIEKCSNNPTERFEASVNPFYCL